MSANVGVVFASTGGNKLVRTIRSFRKAEPDLPIHVVIDVESRTWRSSVDSKDILDYLFAQPNVKVDTYRDNTNHWINGTLNAAMGWMKEIGYSHACLFHDDLVFSPLKENRYHVSEWFKRLVTWDRLGVASALSFSCMETFAKNPGTVEGQPGNWTRSPAEWDSMDLESEELWNKLLPGGKPVGYFGIEKPVGKVDFDTWFIHCYGVEKVRLATRLGPTGQIIPITAWEKVGKFDEKEGLVYDLDYPVAAILAGLNPVLYIPNVPHLHLHNQSIGFSDPSTGIWSNCIESFIRYHGWSPTEFWKEQGIIG